MSNSLALCKSVLVSLSATGYPDFKPDCIGVLQNLYDSGYDIVLANGTNFKDKMAKVEAFNDAHVSIRLKPRATRDFFLKIKDDYFVLNGIRYEYDGEDMWDYLDFILEDMDVYRHFPHLPFTCGAKKGHDFIVYDFGLANHTVERATRKERTCRSMIKQAFEEEENRKKWSSATIFDCHTLEAKTYYDAKTGKFEALEPRIYYPLCIDRI